MTGTAHVPAPDHVEDPAGHHRVVGRAPRRHVGQRLPTIRGRGVPRDRPARMQDRGLGDGGVGGGHAADPIDGSAVRDEDRTLEAGAARQLFPRRAGGENQPPKPGADVLEGVGMDPADMAPVDVECSVEADGAEAGDGIDQIGRTPPAEGIVLRARGAGSGEQQREDEGEDEAGATRQRFRMAHDEVPINDIESESQFQHGALYVPPTRLVKKESCPMTHEPERGVVSNDK